MEPERVGTCPDQNPRRFLHTSRELQLVVDSVPEVEVRVDEVVRLVFAALRIVPHVDQRIGAICAVQVCSPNPLGRGGL